MELQIPGLDAIQQELKELKEMVSNLDPSNKEETYIPKTKMHLIYDLSSSTLRNREQDGSLTVHKIGDRVYYKLSEITSILEKSVKK